MTPPDAPDAPRDLTYEIVTVGDFLKVPPKRLGACLREFKIALEMARATDTLLSVSAETLHPGASVNTTFTRFRWIDDGKRTASLNIEVAEGASRPEEPE